MKITKFKSIKRENGLTEIRKELREDIKLCILGCSFVIPFVFLMFFDAPVWAWLIWIAWVALFVYANSRPRKRRERKFQHYEIEDENEEGAA